MSDVPAPWKGGVPFAARFAAALVAVACAIGGVAGAARAAGDAARVDPLGREYFLYLPKRVDAEKRYWLMAGIHGFGGNGKGAAGYAAWATQRDDVIVVGPTMPTPMYTYAEDRSDEQLLAIHKQLAERYKLHERIFVAGFSGGAQFAHRFAMAHPDRVVGCAAHSGGSWATGGQWKSINPKAAAIPLVISCGEADTAKMAAGAPMTRVEWAHAFEKLATEAGFALRSAYFPGVGHQMTPAAMKMSVECFELATALDASRPNLERQIAAIEKQASRGSAATAVRMADELRAKAKEDEGVKLPDGWTAGDAAKSAMAERRAEAVERAIAEALEPAVAKGLAMVRQVAERDGAGKAEQLERLRKMYAGLAAVEAAVDKAMKGAGDPP